MKYKVAVDILNNVSSGITELERESHSGLFALNRDQRKRYWNTKDTKEKRQIADSIVAIQPFDYQKDTAPSSLKQWIADNRSKTKWQSYYGYYYEIEDVVSILNHFRMLWIDHIQQHDDSTKCIKSSDAMDDGDDSKFAESIIKSTECNDSIHEVHQSTYLQWDHNRPSSKKSKIQKDRVHDLYLKSLWPHIFSGPYYRSINNSANREWRCKKCKKSGPEKGGHFPYYKTKRTVFTYEVCVECILKAKQENVTLLTDRILKRKQKRKGT